MLTKLRLASQAAMLSDAERQQIMDAARTEVSVVDEKEGTRFFEEPYELKTGRPSLAALGLENRMKVDPASFHARMAIGADAIIQEAAEFAACSPEDAAELRDIVDYVINRQTEEKKYPNGIRDEGRFRVMPCHFVWHPSARAAELNEAEVFALRLYTTLVFRHMNSPLRDEERYLRGEPVPLPATSMMAAEAIKKLRAVRAEAEQQEVVMWRGMRNRRVAEAFMTKGGTELAFMSTTTDLRVAVRYSLSRHSLLLRIVAPNFMAHGADLRWLSAFPGEAEVLYPPLTFLKPTGRTEKVDAMDRDGRPVTFTVIEVNPFISG